MMKRVILGVLAAWSAIVALAWYLANERLEWCSSIHGRVADCNQVAAMATRDNVLIWGLAIPLFVFVGLATLALVRLNRDPRSPIATPELRSRLPR